MARLPPDAARRRHPLCVLGHSHALSGLAAGAATLPWAPVHGTVSQVAWVAAAGGFAMLPDLDHSGSTVSDMWGPITDVPSGAIGRLAQGHRWGTHDAVLGPLAFGALAVPAAGAFWSSLLLMALAIGLALRALNFAIPGRMENTVVGNLVLSWGGAWLLLDHSPNPAWLPWAVALGCLTHIAGDALTTAGIPVPLSGSPAVPARSCCRSGPATSWRRPSWSRVPFVAALCLYLNTEAHTALDPIVERISASAD